jgi:hypothetical protein
MATLWTRWLRNPHLFSNWGEPVQPLFWPIVSTTIAITAAVLQAPEVETLRWILPEESVLPSIKVFCSRPRSQIRQGTALLIQNTSNNREQMQHGNNNAGNSSRNRLQILLSLSNQSGLTGGILHLSLKIRTGKQLRRRQPKHPPNPLKQFQQPDRRPDQTPRETHQARG